MKTIVRTCNKWLLFLSSSFSSSLALLLLLQNIDILKISIVSNILNFLHCIIKFLLSRNFSLLVLYLFGGCVEVRFAMSLTKLLSARIVLKRLPSLETPVSGLGAPTTTFRFDNSPENTHRTHWKLLYLHFITGRRYKLKLAKRGNI